MNIHPEEAKYQIKDFNFDGYYDIISKQFDSGAQRIQLYGIGKFIPIVISLASTFVEEQIAVMEKLNTESLEADNSSEGKKVQLTAIIKKKH